MSVWKLVKLDFQTNPVHFGELGIGMEETAERIHSDTLFSAWFSAYARLYPDRIQALFDRFPIDEVSELEPPFRVSSTFVYGKNGTQTDADTYYLPTLLTLPTGYPHGNLQFAKAFRKLKFLPLSIWHCWYQGTGISDRELDELLTKSGNLARSGTFDYGKIFNSQTLPKVAVDRIHNATNFYQTSFIYFDKGGLYFLFYMPVPDDELYRQLQTALIKDRQEIGTLLKQVFGDDWVRLKSPDDRSIFPIRLSKWTEDKITEFRPMIRNGMGQLYIPGSSIKGAIRTALTYYLVKHYARFHTPKEQQPSELEKKIRDKMNAPEFGRKFTHASFDDRLLIDPLFTNYQLRNRDREITAKLGPNTDFMRAIKISDSAPLIRRNVKLKSGKTRPDNTAIAGSVTVSSYYGDDKSKYRATIYAEMVRLANTTFTIRLDREMLSWFEHQQGMKIPINSISDLLNICQEFSQEIWDEEHDYWNAVNNNPDRHHQLDFDDIRTLYDPETCPYHLRLGWGTGMTGTTIGLALPDKLRQEIRDACGIAAPGFDAPKSRRTVANNSGELKYALGWTKLDIVNI